MWFDLTLEARDGGRHHVRYNPHTSECEGLPLPVEPGVFAQVARVAKDKPLGKSRAPRVLKIQLGLSCNYACSYCSQAFQIADATVSKLADVEHFLTQLDGWIADAPEKIELWGGEPFLYWAKIKRLIPALAERFPSARFSIITNGSLLDREKLDFIAQYDIAIGISHDGPGQHLRGPDPLDDPDKRQCIETLLAERPEKTGFNAVLTREHHDLKALKAWFADKVGPDIFVGLEGVVNVYDAATAIGTGRFEPAELNSLTRSIFEAMVEDPNAFGLGERINEFYASIQRRRPIEAHGQKCGMDSHDAIAVDLRGNVMTCQNTGAKGEHKIGHVANFDAIALDTATHFAFRDECMSCPVVQLCKGSCMFLEGEFFKQSCANEFAFNMGIMMAAVWHLTGMVVREVKRQDR
ncbi:radical SAM protein [Phaeobacter gallaeciensis]|uniref:Radical SAM protein n=1 Tax=Phaeobacter gallaeciensis TaxID=60890 RepID=A0ABD4XG23_9RHOB|nr:radical SAM protein [Phaeobacter gallaeciensis]MDE4146972.1 radical SAM protein [Phaeobacter gallaeciensis]MDE4159567.1 radical SAM protein [Phaeobacter gallaeciensis]MDE4163821.1 radical SAM protein [Phaeobacter gallaeciensis]MDE4168022.1 radical SAM protein [Phaeobacter gallaeciensis]MDE4172288.1 radical SAM protein [Phaeobacter gallaeciensis]